MGVIQRAANMLQCIVSRSANDIFQWRRDGFGTPPPHTVKIGMLAHYMRTYGLKKFIETGTFRGSTLHKMARLGFDCTSIELADGLYEAAIAKFAHYPNVKLIHGDSGVVIPKILETLNEPALFWLDGHYSGGPTAQGDKFTPVAEELDAILRHPISGHVVLIDDARCFTGEDDYPPLHELLTAVAENGRYTYQVHCDSIHLLPIAVPASKAA